MTRAGLPTTTAPGGHVADDDGAGADEGVLADDDAGQQRDVGADLGALANHRARQLVLDARRKRILGVGQHHVRTDPAALLEDREFGDEHLGVDPHVVGDLHVVLDHRQRSDADVVADAVRFADVDLVPGLEMSPDGVAGVDHRVGANHRSVADRGGQLSVADASRRSADDAEVLHDVPSPSMTFS